MKSRKFTILCILSLTSGFYLFSQGQENNFASDSLKRAYYNTHDNHEKVEILSTLIGSFKNDELDSTLYYCQLLMNLGNSINHPTANTMAISKVGKVMSLKGMHDTAIACTNNALNKIDNLNHQEKVKVYQNAGYSYFHNKDYITALEHYHNAVSVLKTMEEKDIGALVKLLITTGRVYSRADVNEKALEQFLEALRYEDHPDITEEIKGVLFNNVASQYAILKNYEKAVFYGNKAYNIDLKVNDVPGQIMALGNLGKTYGEAGEIEQAGKSLHHAYELAKKHEVNQFIPALAISLNKFYQSTGRLDEAKIYLETSIKWALKVERPNELIFAYVEMAHLHIKTKNYSVAKQYLEKGSTLIDEERSSNTLLKYYKTTSTLDSILGDYQNSLINHHLAMKYQNHLFNEKKSMAINELELRYQTDIKDKEINTLKKENKLQLVVNDEQQKAFIALIIAIATLTLLSVLLFYGYRTKQRSVKVIRSQKEIIEEQNAENKLLVKEMHHHVKNNLQIMHSLLNTQKIMFSEDDRARSIIRESQNRIKSIALIYENLYQSGSYIMVNADGYFQELLYHIQKSFSEEKHNMELKTFIADEKMTMALAVPLGLIMNELMSNSYKYAFSNIKNPELEINFVKMEEENTYLLEVVDNGVGLPEGFNIETSKSFGLQMVNGLAQQLDGSMKVNNENGTRFKIVVKDLRQG